MTDGKSYLKKLIEAKGFSLPEKKQHLLENFANQDDIKEILETIISQQTTLMDKWKIKNAVDDVMNTHLLIPNATSGKEYAAKIDYNKYQLHQLLKIQWNGLEEYGLSYNSENESIEGIPNQSGELKFKMLFKVAGEEETAALNEKIVTLIVNPDPKTLWKNIPSDTNALFWKADDTNASGKLGEKHIVVASNRGRSHENVGSFRDDDFAFKYIESNQWSVVAVADGAGSYSFSRKGAEIACNAIVQYFDSEYDPEQFSDFENKIKEYQPGSEELLHLSKVAAKKIMYKAVLYAHNQIKNVAETTFNEHPDLFNNSKSKSLLDYFHTTLIFTLFKKFDFGYVILSFGVGDCPIAVIDRDLSQTQLLNTLDVGEFGGGTRFLTQHDIYQQDAKPLTMAERFNFIIIPDFSYLFLMTDGIYDAKFVVEANLNKHEKWLEFLKDLQGENDDKLKVELSPDNETIAQALSNWMDFWSPGNHDDRTLAIIY